MSDTGPACFGKLPFSLLDRLQIACGISKDCWADAVSVPGTNSCLTSIDTIALDHESLPNSVAMAILHSMNDIFAANGIPLSFSLSMSLPPETDIDVLSCINQAIIGCAKLANCRIGKLHTSRMEGTPTATVCVNGQPTDMTAQAASRGKVVLVGGHIASIAPYRLYTEAATTGLAIRMEIARTIAGPKKDVSGDGLGGTVLQLSKRNIVSIRLCERSLLSLSGPQVEGRDLEKNFLDYAGLINGSYSPALRTSLFAPRIFGPIVCLVDESAKVDPSMSVTIGSFEAGHSSVRLTTT